MATSIPLKAKINLGVVPTHIKFVGGLVPDDDGRLPRGDDGKLKIVAEMEALTAESPVKIQSAQITFFPGVDDGDTEELINGLRALDLEVFPILMVGGADPMKPEDEDAVVEMLVSGLKTAVKFGIEQVASTSIEEWMQPGATPKTGAEFDAAVAQNVKVHTRAVKESGALEGGVKAWHIEFLRGGEFQTFTDVAKAWSLVKAANEGLGQSFF
ncbi:MAG: hypothetical protein AAGA58_08155, partial [Verrucomicrobiota bacterium]